MKLWMRHYRAAAFVALLFAAWAPQGHAQGTRKDDVVINSAGQPVGGATVRVCAAAASGTPCAPLANVYSDIGLTQPLANPLTADGLGNYYFYAAPGKYTIEISGTSLTDKQYPNVLLPNDPATVPVKPQASDSVEYVSPNGNDSNDGLSMGTAKATIMGAYDALGQGGGTVYITGSSTSGAYCTSTPGQGLWIMGSSDPNYASPPAGWRKMKTGGPVYFVGLSANTSPAASTTSWTTVVNCGNNTNPGVWLSGVSGVTVSRLRLVSQSVRVSMDSNGGRNNATNPSAQIEFDHDDFRSDCSGCGPTMDVGGNVLWLNVHDSTFENGAIANWSVSANSSQASNISISNGGGSGPLGLLYFNQNFFTGGGGLRFDANTNSTASVYAAHTLMEGAGNCQPVYEIINGGTFAATFDLQGGFSDCGASPPFVKVAAGNQPCQTSVRGINQGGQVPGLEGPLTVGDAICPGGNPSGGVSVSDAGIPSSGVIPAAKGQSGGVYGISQNADSYRRSFAPSLVRFANTANQLPSTWTAYQGSGQALTQIQGPGDPSGATNAATLSCTGQSGFGCSYYVFDSDITFGAGDYVYVGAWVQAASTAGFGSGSAIGAIFPFSNGPTMRQMAGGPAGVGGAFSGGTTQLSASPYLQNDGNWQYVWGLSKVTAPFSGASGTIFVFTFQPGYPINVYAPMFVRIPASSVAVVTAPAFSSASESGNIVTFTTSAAHNLSRGQPIVVSGCSVSGYNGEFVLGNTISSTSFTVYNSTTGLGSPTGCVITPGNDSEVADWANNLKSYSDKCSTGILCDVVSDPQISASGLNSVIYVDGVKYTTIASAIAASCALAVHSTVVIPAGVYTENPPPMCSNIDIGGTGANGPASVGGTKINTSIASGNFFDIAGLLNVHIHDLWLHNTNTSATTAQAIALHWGQGVVAERLYVDGYWSSVVTLNPSAGVASTISNHFRDSQFNTTASSSTGCLLDALTSGDKVVNANTFDNVICSGTQYALRLQGGGGGGNTFINENTVIGSQFYTGGTGTGISAAASSTYDLNLIGVTVENNSTGIASVSGNVINWSGGTLDSNSTEISDANHNIRFWGGRGPVLGLQTFAVDQNGSLNLYGLCFGATICSQNAINGPANWSLQGAGATIVSLPSHLLISATAPTISSGFGTAPSIVQQNGTAAFEVNVGTGGSATSGVIGLPTATNGWSCQVTDMSTNIVTRETAFTATSVTLTAASAWTASDKLLVNCSAF